MKQVVSLEAVFGGQCTVTNRMDVPVVVGQFKHGTPSKILQPGKSDTVPAGPFGAISTGNAGGTTLSFPVCEPGQRYSVTQAAWPHWKKNAKLTLE